MTAIGLDQLAIGQVARIVDVEGDDGIATRILEMGLVMGEEIRLLGRAPFGDPLEFFTCGYRISLRVAEARRVRVEVV